MVLMDLNCGICRRSIVKTLIDNNVLSNQIRNEIEHDSYEKTRELAIRLKRKVKINRPVGQ